MAGGLLGPPLISLWAFCLYMSSLRPRIAGFPYGIAILQLSEVIRSLSTAIALYTFLAILKGG